MKKVTSVILITGLVMGHMQMSYAISKNTRQSFIADSTYSVEQVISEASTDRLLKNTRTLLETSPVSLKLRDSNNPADRARYLEALETYKKAEAARSAGNYKNAENLAIETARVIARAMPDFHKRLTNTRKL